MTMPDGVTLACVSMESPSHVASRTSGAAAADLCGCGPETLFGGDEPTEDVMPAKRADFRRECPRRDSNPCYGLERAVT